MFRLIIVLIVMLAQQKTYAENQSIDYISQYKDIAISEMHRTGIPASIKMAQALLESGAGKSTLALKANNHFGIKCGNSWNGGTFYREDDDYKNGKLIKSCFRQFNSVSESYIAHSDFLTKQKRYAFLFNYHKDDYKSWAKGLRKAGYATDKKYPQKLIHIIEKYQLYELDNLEAPILAQNNRKRTKEESTESSHASKVIAAAETSNTVVKENYKTPPSSRKRRRVDEEAKYHIVQEQQSIAEIAMLYDLEETAIRLRNRLPKDAEPLKGEKIFLRKKI
ncbi:MAG: hypothetical protein HKN51_00715, partial [Saprospiraceae bacterium]|nr:glucosaminidase domain-containing protein [Bacteroidia bacterium]NNE13463.1 hypothetical protein [Saprospiraceae bacterium]